MKKIILGISCFYHDSSACLLVNGEIIAAAQNERFSRIKNDSNFPAEAINFCFDFAQIDEQDLDFVVFYENPYLVLDRISKSLLNKNKIFSLKFLNKIGSTWKSYKLNFESLFKFHFPYFKGQILFSDHHHSHAASAFYPSPYNNAAILTIDGVGEWSTASISIGKGNKIEKLKEMNFPNSIGLFYSTFTNFLGFKINSGEYKVMGLAPYGKPVFSKLLEKEVITIFDDGSIKLNMDYFDFLSANKMYTKKLQSLLNYFPKDEKDIISQFKMNLASSVQVITEKVMLKMARYAKKITKLDNLCMSGGVALNCVGNTKILQSQIFKNIWVQPASGDAGSSLGAAYVGWFDFLKQKRKSKKNDSMKSSLLGPSYNKDEIKDFLNLYNFPFEELSENNLSEKVAKLLAKGKIIGILQGRMEFGPRALCARSILGDPRNPEMQNIMNLKIKFRESFRPFAPIILKEELSKWFMISKESRYMLFIDYLKNEKRIKNNKENLKITNLLKLKRSPVSAVTHVDFSSRIQTIDKFSAPRIKNILKTFYYKTNVPILINTSFNLRGEPIVCSPLDAYRCMMRSNIDYILLENILVSRNKQPKWPKNAKGLLNEND